MRQAARAGGGERKDGPEGSPATAINLDTGALLKLCLLFFQLLVAAPVKVVLLEILIVGTGKTWSTRMGGRAVEIEAGRRIACEPVWVVDGRFSRGRYLVGILTVEIMSGREVKRQVYLIMTGFGRIWI